MIFPDHEGINVVDADVALGQHLQHLVQAAAPVFDLHGDDVLRLDEKPLSFNSCAVSSGPVYDEPQDTELRRIKGRNGPED